MPSVALHCWDLVPSEPLTGLLWARGRARPAGGTSFQPCPGPVRCWQCQWTVEEKAGGTGPATGHLGWLCPQRVGLLSRMSHAGLDEEGVWWLG